MNSMKRILGSNKGDEAVTADIFVKWLCSYIEKRGKDVGERMERSKHSLQRYSYKPSVAVKEEQQ